ncbi:Zn-dependent hydrolase [Pseudotabrizicola sediminis]|uniref:Zn-dependent hydrolase n=1 Tax=Pseudotabrizicola sediminis TaxID=2486418 RepID=A0ABY2KJT0_9RHOB|nr:MBL fold metallo-hydrolase [Pseudotabrizicola sediminis]TGD42695.1 Zn-dependent hydrolase [Pseudotabrizicola sediminis]
MRFTILPALLLSLLSAPVLAQDRIPSHCFAVAQGISRVMPVSFATGLAQDQVRIHFIGHASFAIAAGGTTAVTDFTGYTGMADWAPDVVTMNNAHSTHWTANPDPRIPNVLQGWADAAGPAQHELDLGAMLVRNVPTDVRSRWGDGARADGNSIFVFEAGGLCIGHLGHLHHAPDDAQYASIGRLDVVMVPVDGGYTMAVSEMAEVVRRLRSSIVIPMHWFSGSSLRMFLDNMSAEFEVVETGMPSLDVSLRNLPGRPTIMLLLPEGID